MKKHCERKVEMKQRKVVSMIGALILIISALLLITGCSQPNSNKGNNSGNTGGSSTVTERYRFENKSSFTVNFHAGSCGGRLSPYPASDYWCTCDLVKGTSSDDVRYEPADKVWVISTGYNTFTFVDK